jgi:hypothetical protein
VRVMFRALTSYVYGQVMLSMNASAAGGLSSGSSAQLEQCCLASALWSAEWAVLHAHGLSRQEELQRILLACWKPLLGASAACVAMLGVLSEWFPREQSQSFLEPISEEILALQHTSLRAAWTPASAGVGTLWHTVSEAAKRLIPTTTRQLCVYLGRLAAPGGRKRVTSVSTESEGPGEDGGTRSRSDSVDNGRPTSGNPTRRRVQPQPSKGVSDAANSAGSREDIGRAALPRTSRLRDTLREEFFRQHTVLADVARFLVDICTRNACERVQSRWVHVGLTREAEHWREAVCGEYLQHARRRGVRNGTGLASSELPVLWLCVACEQRYGFDASVGANTGEGSREREGSGLGWREPYRVEIASKGRECSMCQRVAAMVSALGPMAGELAVQDAEAHFSAVLRKLVPVDVEPAVLQTAERQLVEYLRERCEERMGEVLQKSIVQEFSELIRMRRKQLRETAWELVADEHSGEESRRQPRTGAAGGLELDSVRGQLRDMVDRLGSIGWFGFLRASVEVLAALVPDMRVLVCKDVCEVVKAKGHVLAATDFGDTAALSGFGAVEWQLFDDLTVGLASSGLDMAWLDEIGSHCAQSGLDEVGVCDDDVCVIVCV